MTQTYGISVLQVWPSHFMKARWVLLLHLVHLSECTYSDFFHSYFLVCRRPWCALVIGVIGVLVNSCNSREIYTYKVCMSCFLFRTQWNDIYCKDTRRIKVSNLREIAVSGDYGLGAKGSQKIVECSSSVTTYSSWYDGVSLICKIDTNPIVSARKCNHCP